MRAPTMGAALLAIIAVSAATNSGCVSRSARAGSAASLKLAPAIIRVINYNWHDARVYANRGGAKHRLGVVHSASSGTFRVPEYLYKLGGHVELRVELIGSSETHTALPIPCGPGDLIEWRIRRVLKHTSAMVY